MNQSLIIKHIQQDSPQTQLSQAENFVEQLRADKVDLRTTNAIFSLANAGFNETNYSIDQLKHISYGGIIEAPTTGTTGQRIISGFYLVNKESETQRLPVGFDTGLKFFGAAKKAELDILPEITHIMKKNEKVYDSLTDEITVDDVFLDNEKIKDVESRTQRRQIKGLVGLDNELNILNKNLEEILLFGTETEKSQVNEHLQSVLHVGGGHLKRLQARYTALSEEKQRQIDLVTKHRKFLSTTEYLTIDKELRMFDAHTSPMPVDSVLTHYFTDLSIILNEEENTPLGEQTLTYINQLQSNMSYATPAVISSILGMYDIRGKRVEKVKTQLEEKGGDYKESAEKGIDLAEKLFVVEGEYIGGKKNSVPKDITAALKGSVKVGDEHLRTVQAYARAQYVSDTSENIFRNNTIATNEKTLDSLVVMQRRDNITHKEELGTWEKFIPLDAKDIMPVENMNLSIDQAILRIEDRYHPLKENHKEVVSFEQYRMLKAAEEGKLITSKNAELPEEITSLEKVTSEDRHNYEVVQEFRTLRDITIESYDSAKWYGETTPEFMTAQEKASLVGYEQIVEELKHIKKQFGEEAQQAIKKYTTMQHSKTKTLALNKERSIEKGYESSHITHKEEGYQVNYITADNMPEFIEEMNKFVELDEETREKGEKLFSFQGRKKHNLTGEQSTLNKNWGTMKNAVTNRWTNTIYISTDLKDYIHEHT